MYSAEKIKKLATMQTRFADVLVMAITLAASLATFGIPDEPNDRPIDALAIALVALPSLCVLFRRNHPSAMLFIAAVPSFAFWVIGYPDAGGFFTLAVLLFAVPQYSASQRNSILTQIAFFSGLLALLVSGYFWEHEDDVSIGTIIGNIIFYQLVWLASQAVSARRAAFEKLRTEVEQARKDVAVHTQQAVTAEQNRIARELHDIIAHSMSVIVVQAGGAKRLLGHDEVRASKALDTIETTGRQTLTDIRGIVGLLRSGDGHQPTPGLAALDALLEQSEQSGVSTTLEVDGEKLKLPLMIELSSYRVIQESLTNVLKHAGSNPTATVRLSYKPHQLRIVVTDTGRGSATTGGGFGLIGMRERVEAFGGELHHGPQIGGGFKVDAIFPIGDSP